VSRRKSQLKVWNATASPGGWLIKFAQTNWFEEAIFRAQWRWIRVVLNPTIDMPQRDTGVSNQWDAKIISRQGFDEGIGYAVELRTGERDQTGQIDALAKGLIFVAV
jgi:hypothetical protein